MSRLCVRAFSVSLDGYGAGPDQSLENPLGANGMNLHQWAFKTRTFRKMFGQDGGDTDVDDEFAARSFTNVVTDGIRSALQQAQDAASGKDIRVGGGVSTVRQYLSTRLLDEIHLAMVPVFLGSGENLFVGLDLPALGYSCTDRVSTPAATHLTVTKHR